MRICKARLLGYLLHKVPLSSFVKLRPTFSSPIPGHRDTEVTNGKARSEVFTTTKFMFSGKNISPRITFPCHSLVLSVLFMFRETSRIEVT